MPTIKSLNLTKVCKTCGTEFRKPEDNSMNTWGARLYCSIPCSNTLIKKGQKLPEAWVAKMRGRVSPKKGKKSLQSGKNHYNWKGGPVEKVCLQCSDNFMVERYRAGTAKFCSPACKKAAQDLGKTDQRHRMRRGVKYKEWRQAVFDRDDYTCQICRRRWGELNADHIKPFALFPEFFF